MYEAKVSFLEGDRYNIQMGNAAVEIESVKDGSTPSHMFLASLAGCIAVYARRYLRNSELKDKPFSVAISGELSKEKPVSFREITAALHLPGSGLDEARKKALLDFVHNCPIHNTIADHTSVDIKIA